ncbi:hypothetical protein COLSTE_02236 [Collinsella stercoris DSM 13279]|uniref:Uncharacterized protein n=1 Tax=Collinsella stercoris DSM 13279 TaxID=445975 RepID=B6GDQ3_9ACTN|nr:hypothetical protein COLSTE_02236 [Collinsella stercoris DSM 13279]
MFGLTHLPLAPSRCGRLCPCAETRPSVRPKCALLHLEKVVERYT